MDTYMLEGEKKYSALAEECEIYFRGVLEDSKKYASCTKGVPPVEEICI